MRVFAMGELGREGGRVGTVVGVKSKFNSSTVHLIAFVGGARHDPEEVLLQKVVGTKKGWRFHVLQEHAGQLSHLSQL